jgi:Na+/H+-translocating membrane pyrophosphatase
VSYVVSPNVLGTAWGAVGSSLGLSQCLVPLIFIPIINSNFDISISYELVNLFGVAFAAISVLFSIWIICWENYSVLDRYYAK